MDAYVWARPYQQIVFKSPVTVEFFEWKDSVPKNTLAVPFFTASFFIVVQCIHAFVAAIRRRKRTSTEEQPLQPGSEDLLETPSFLGFQIKHHGSLSIFIYTVLRLLGCIALLSISIFNVVQCPELHEHSATPWFRRVLSSCPELFMTFTYAYSTILAIISLTVKSLSTFAARYNISVLLVAFFMYCYRDLWPLATLYDAPKDRSEGVLLWVKIALLGLTAIIIPLFIPRRYTPVDPNDPMPETNDEQTCSLFSLITYIYLDPVVLLGYRVPHLKYDQLPPLSDTDYARNLRKKAFPHLDPYSGAKKRHIFFGLMKVYRKEYLILALTIIGQAGFVFATPIGTNQLLLYIEKPELATIRPWFWILCMFSGPLLRNLCFNWYIFIATRTLVRTEGLLTQLVFEHSLRIRMKAETDPEKESLVAITAASTPDTASVAGSEAGSSSGDRVSESTAVGSREVSNKSQATSTAPKGKSKDTSSILSSSSATKLAKKEAIGANNLIGKINNLVTTDLSNVVDARDFLLVVLYVPLQITFCIIFLYKLLGWSAFTGLATMILLFPIPGFITKKIQDVQRVRMKKTDARVQDVTEAVNVLRMIKLFGWEGQVSQRIQDKRTDELSSLWKLKVLEVLNAVINHIIPTIVMLITYATFTVIMKQELTSSKIFSTMIVFNMLRMQLFRISWQISQSTQGKVSLDRIHDFLQNTDLLDSFTESPQVTAGISPREDMIGFRNAAFSWSLDSEDGSLTPSSRRSFKLTIDGELTFKSNCINLIIGPTGSGKTSMLMGLLGEMHFIPSTPDAWFSLPRDGGVAYAAQESWVQNETIRDNILFGFPYDEQRYKKVLYQCALEKDLDLFEAGDKTEVGEKGLTLSGGQKARVTLARAIYSPAKTILLDDILAALDVHTSAWIVDKCLRGDLIKGRTVLMVTHNVALASPIARYIVTVNIDGTVHGQENGLNDALDEDPLLAAEVEQDRQETEIAKQEIPSAVKGEAPGHGKLIVAEEIVEGSVTWKSFKLLLSGLGGNYPILFFSLWAVGIMSTDWISAFQVWFLGYWGSQYETHHASEVNVAFYLTLYTLILLGMVFLYVFTDVLFAFGSLRASKAINTALVDSVLRSTLRWLDETPAARVIARCTQDIRAIDGPIPQTFGAVAEISNTIITRIIVVVVFSPVFLFPGISVCALGLYLGNMYLKAQLSVKREMSNARSPLLAHFSAAIAGIVSIRAYNAQDAFKAESLKRIDHYIRIARMSYNLNRWINVRIDVVGAVFTAALATYLVYGRPVGASNTGFSLNMAVEFCTMILWWVRIFNELEVQANSLERIQGYIEIDHEPKPTEARKPPAAWPTSGELRVENLSARYSKDGPKVLHDLSFQIRSGERVGIVGRTGSGKSSLTLALLRCILTEGDVYLDGVSTNQINLDALRSNITIIPQTPELLSGTMRRNLDPFEQHDDAVLNDALRAAGLFTLQEELGEAKLSLDSNVSSGGGNLSVGQRQIIALARAMVRGSKVLILDEATSAIDYKTDSVIQSTLRHQLGSDVTIITIAHRLQTIMDADKIMVLDSGKIAEFDSPKILLENGEGLLKALVEESGDKDALYSMADAKASTSSHK